MKKHIISDDGNVTLRQWLKHYYPHIGYHALQEYIRKGDIRVNNAKQSPSCIINVGDKISIWHTLCCVDKQIEKRIPNYDIKFIEKNDKFCVIDKPYGIATQGGTKICISVVDIMQQIFKTKVYIVHRLDKLTTGLMVIALDSYTANKLSESIRAREWNKIYIAKLEQRPTNVAQSGTINMDVYGKMALTEYQLHNSNFAIFKPITGRKHQIRWHSAKFLSPLWGDKKFGSTVKDKMFLRCIKLEFCFDQKKYTFSLDNDFFSFDNDCSTQMT